MKPLDVDASRARRDADLCVKCGLCLPHCPTYLDSRAEGDGPRGRIALIQALTENPALADDGRLQAHLDGCLHCRACEAVCPAGVPYGRLIDGFELSAPLTTENFEGVAAVAGPHCGTRFYIIADDNFGTYDGKPTGQRTLMLAFDWKP